jgi:hypothetical protein
MPSTITSTVVTITKWSTELKDTGYITKEDLQAKLEEVFGPEGCKREDYKIAVRFSIPCLSLLIAAQDLDGFVLTRRGMSRPETRGGHTTHPES